MPELIIDLAIISGVIDAGRILVNPLGNAPAKELVADDNGPPGIPKYAPSAIAIGGTERISMMLLKRSPKNPLLVLGSSKSYTR